MRGGNPRQEGRIYDRRTKYTPRANPKKEDKNLAQVLEDNRNNYFALAPHKENRECERREVIVEQ